MKPRSLRHRLEKAAKALVLIHKWTPNADCILDEDKGEHGHLILKFDDGDNSKMNALGKDLESKGYRFRVKNSPWLGQVTYIGKADDKPAIVITLPMTKDRLAINEDSPEQPYSFK
ncbi:MAG: hypothetical protein ABS34_04035 [Opitutaceae bacterium BACL24 MAG-120322-bin51]|jgi:hypothetical protein|nr:MAG: hypothetical protein ABS34_04035 [Opitutaceae bacterium BACL24 MAG-120322-bin51]